MGTSKKFQPKQMIGLGIIVAALIGAFFTWRPVASAPFEGNRLPPFSIMNRDGDLVSEAEFRNKPLVVNFWATWCEPCKAEMPMLDAMYEKSGGAFELIAVTDEPLPTAERFFTDMQLNIPLFIDVDRSMHEEYLIRFMPTTFFIAPSGVIHHIYMGQMDDAMFLEKLKPLLASADYDQLRQSLSF